MLKQRFFNYLYVKTKYFTTKNSHWQNITRNWHERDIETEEENCLRRSQLLYPLLHVMFSLQLQVLDFIVDFEDQISDFRFYFGECIYAHFYDITSFATIIIFSHFQAVASN